MSWTDDRVATLTKLWNDGLSASIIAQRIGEVTRNAVIGKVHRLGLAGPPSRSTRTPCPARSLSFDRTPTRHKIWLPDPSAQGVADP